MPKSDALGLLILRATTGVLMLFHGVAKLMHGVSGISGLLQSKGLPGFLAYGVYVGEVVAPLLLIVGLYTRPAAWVVALNMVVAVLLVHPGDLLRLGENGEWALELHAFYFFCAVAIALLGPGRLSWSKGRGKWD